MTDEEFMRHQAERAWDSMQLAQIAELQLVLADYAQHGWRPMDVLPPTNVPLVCMADEGVVIMVLNNMGEWRASGTPHKPPTHWMPCPMPPRAGNGRRSMVSLQGGKVQ